MAKTKKSANKPNVTKISASDDEIEKKTVAEEVEDEEEKKDVVEDEDAENEDDEDEDDEDEDDDEDDDEEEDDEDDEEEDEDDDDDEDDEEDEEDEEDDDNDEGESPNDNMDRQMKEAKTVVKEATTVTSTAATVVAANDKEDLPNGGFFKRLFRKKRETHESILTIFNHRNIYGALLGEVIGTFLITAVVLTLGLYQPLYMFFTILAVTIGVYKLSGANLNPINTFGMMVSRRISAIRGVLYLLAQVVGAWLGYLLVSMFIGIAAGVAGGEAGEMPGMTPIEDNLRMATILIEAIGALIVGLTFARAQDYKDNPLAFGAVVAGGVTIATVVVYLISYSYFGLQGNFMMNPAIALMYQILPTSADGFGELMSGIGQALLCYVLIPMGAGAIGFLISDIADVFSEE